MQAESLFKSMTREQEPQVRFIMAVFELLLFGALVISALKVAQIIEKHFAMVKVMESISEPNFWELICIPFKNFGSEKALDFMMNVTKLMGSPVKIWYGPTKAIIFIDTPDDIKAVFTSENAVDKPFYYEYFNFGKGLFVSKKDVWAKHRKIISRGVNNKMLEVSIPIICEKSEKYVKSLSEKSGGEEFDVMESVIDCVLEMMFKTFFGMDTEAKMREEYTQFSEKISDLSMERTSTICFFSDLIYFFSSNYWEEKKLLKDFDKFFGEIVHTIRIQSVEKFTKDPQSHKKIGDLLFDEKNEFSDDEIQDHAKAFVYGGYDTLTSTTSVALMMLAIHKNVQQKSYEEVKSFFEGCNGEVTLNDVNNLPYLEMVIKETMRLYPPVSLVGRYSTGTVKMGKHTIPSDVPIQVNVYNLHNNPKYWGEDVEQFIPERFEPESFSKIHPYAYLPFANGPRICLAWKYGLMSLKLLIAHLLYSYEFSTTRKFEEIEINVPIILKFKNGYKLSLKKRSK